MMMAPSAALGSDANSGVRNAIVTKTTPAVIRDANGVRAPAVSLTAVPREAASDGVAAEQAGGYIGRAQSDEFTVGLDLVVVTTGIDLGHGDGLHEPNQSDDGCGGGEVADE